MSLRLVEITLPKSKRAGLVDALRDESVEDRRCVDVWCVDGPEDRSVVRVLVSLEDSESLLDYVTETVGDEARVVVMSVEATLPRVEGPDEENDDEPKHWVFRRISREELYADVVDSSRMTPNYFAMVLAAAVVAAIGLLKDDVAVIIGAMVIAPLLGPNVALALATTLGDVKLAWNALKTNASGLTTALLPAAAIGFFLFPDDATGQIASRSSAGFLDLALALAAGGAGALSFTLGVPAALVGVMVAVALMPPLVVAGMAVGAADWHAAGGAALLTLVNVICVNLSGVVTFLVLGIRPASWYKAARATKATRIAIAFWFGTLALLAGLIYFTG